MHRIFWEKPFTNSIVINDKGTCHHFATVLRLHPGENLYLVNSNQVGEYQIQSINKQEIACTLIEVKSENNELQTKITLGFGPLKNDNTQLVIQKAVELGAFEIALINFKRNISKFDNEKSTKKIEKFMKISQSAANQSRRNIQPKVQVNVDITKAYLQQFDLVFVCYEDEKKNSLNDYKTQISQANSILVLVGPEGGIDPSELAKITEFGHSISLGKRILRAETASINVLSILGHLLEEQI